MALRLGRYITHRSIPLKKSTTTTYSLLVQKFDMNKEDDWLTVQSLRYAYPNLVKYDEKSQRLKLDYEHVQDCTDTVPNKNLCKSRKYHNIIYN
jgi:hypothetical protein